MAIMTTPTANASGARLRSAATFVLLLALSWTAAPGRGAATADRAAELPAAVDPSLQAALERVVREEGLWEPVERQRLALGLLDLSDTDSPRLAMLNPHRMMYAASLPKIAILFGAFVRIAAGELELDDRLREQMTRMIRVSDNASATRVLEAVGREALIELLTSERFRLYDPETGGGLWVGKDYARRAAYRRDPIHNLSHGATVYQVLRFFHLLETGALVPSPYREQMKDILSRPGIPHKFVAGLADREVTAIFRKSGTWREFHADAALVESAAHRYVIVALARHRDAGAWLAGLAGPLHDLVVGENPVRGEAAGRTVRR